MAAVADGDVVLFEKEGSLRLFTLHKGKRLSFDKVCFLADGCIGCCYGDRFQVDGRQLVRVGEELSCHGDVAVSHSADNRAVFDDGSAQELSEEDIRTMKAAGVQGQEIVATVVDHSSSFQDKTKFSQEKYIRKKERKHSPVFRVTRPSTRLLLAMYRELAPAKICSLREDGLARILTSSNVHPGSNMLLMETTQGFLTGALLERMAGQGSLVQVFFGDFPVRNILNNFTHLSQAERAILKMFPLHRIGELSLQDSDAEACAPECPPAGKRLKMEEREEKRLAREAAYSEAAGLLTRGAMDGLVVASRFHPVGILQALLPLVAPSSPIVLYCHISEPLVECYRVLKESEAAFNIQLSESWMRHYQVLEGRTHPLMSMSGTSGFLLTATTITTGTMTSQ